MSRRPPGRRRRRAGGVAVALVAGAGVTLSACGGGASASGSAACARVERSLALYHRSLVAPPAKATTERAAALSELRRAARDAALVSGAGGDFEALAATLEETDRVPESAVAKALATECAPRTAAGS